MGSSTQACSSRRREPTQPFARCDAPGSVGFSFEGVFVGVLGAVAVAAGGREVVESGLMGVPGWMRSISHQRAGRGQLL